MVSRIPMSPSGSSPDLFGTLQREVNRVFDQMFGGGGGLARAGGFAPSLEMKDTDTGLVITAELPGLEEKDVELSLEGDLLTLSGEKRRETAEDKGGFHLSERSYGAFRRSVRLPWAADPARASASFDKGVLTVTLERPPEAKPVTNRIPIGGAKPPA
ncbi:Hsp20/alpha crystallin family protein [Roseomonas sp. JC162]|uniref:Hsp20/alpha crystallin family protein n=1 Tax=Neoroseomonas marina TaxID=1232220 RepID=A0A848ELM1_9PROT|nr:Hsp20/alpha crystallin family protein [Neoroseomonas marina]NMJ44263.1 Hsp20/alpha crystallin family protein [Neoroseomonas marina]